MQKTNQKNDLDHSPSSTACSSLGISWSKIIRDFLVYWNVKEHQVPSQTCSRSSKNGCFTLSVLLLLLLLLNSMFSSPATLVTPRFISRGPRDGNWFWIAIFTASRKHRVLVKTSKFWGCAGPACPQRAWGNISWFMWEVPKNTRQEFEATVPD